MAVQHESSDAQLINLLRHSPAGVAELAEAMNVTATAVRQRLTRLMSQNLVQREAPRGKRGRPSHRYWLTPEARRTLGNNFSDLAFVLWRELRSIKNDEVRRGLLERAAAAMAKLYKDQVEGETLEARMESIAKILAARKVPFAVEQVDHLPVLTALECPYPDLADEDRAICTLERMLFSELLDKEVRLSRCRLDGEGNCQFQTN